MKTTCNYLKTSKEGNANVFRHLFEIRNQLEIRSVTNCEYAREINQILQAMDDLFERMLHD